MHSYISIVLNGENEYINNVSRSACEDVHKTGILKVTETHVIRGIKINQTVTHSIMLAGYIKSEGKWNGVGYSDPFGTWENIAVQGTIKISLSEQIAEIKLNLNTIHSRSGTICSVSDGSCIHQEGGYTFWNPIPIDNCKFYQYSVLYEGLANKMVNYDLNDFQNIYSLSTHDITFALTAKGRKSVCGYTVLRTEHPKLLIFETTKGDSFASNKKILVSNLDIKYNKTYFLTPRTHILQTQGTQIPCNRLLPSQYYVGNK